MSNRTAEAIASVAGADELQAVLDELSARWAARGELSDGEWRIYRAYSAEQFGRWVRYMREVADDTARVLSEWAEYDGMEG